MAIDRIGRLGEKGSNHKGIIYQEAPATSSFLLPRNLSNHMERQDRTHGTVLLKSREMTEANTAVLVGGTPGTGVIKRHKTKKHWPRWFESRHLSNQSVGDKGK